MKDLTDAELVGRYTAAGDESAFAEIARRHGPMVYAACRRQLGSAAEDAVQAVFMLLARKARSLSKREALAGWLHGAANLVAREHLRAAQRRRRAEKEAAEMRQTQRERTGAGWTAVRPEVDAAIGKLPRHYRDAVLLSCVEGRPEAEVARELGVPAGTVKSRVSRGIEKLRERLAQRGKVLGVAGLAALLAENGAEAVPAVLASKVAGLGAVSATAGAAAGAGSASLLMMKGAVKAMFMFKVKIAAAVLGATLVAGTAVPVAGKLVRAGERKGPGAVARPGDAKGGGTTWGRPVNGMRISLATDKATYAKGDPITLTLAFENVSKQPRRVHAYMLNYWHLKWRFEGDIKQSQKRMKFGLARPTEKHFPAIEPGGKTSFTFKSAGSPPSFRHAPVITTTSLVGTGEYHIQVTYENQRDAKVGGRVLPNVWKGSLSSNKIAFKIGSGKIAWGKAVDGLQAGLVPLGGGVDKGWAYAWGCSACKRQGLLGTGMLHKCKACGTRMTGARFCCSSCAAAKRVCTGCGKAKPSSAAFVAGQPLKLEFHLRNAGRAALKTGGYALLHARWKPVWQIEASDGRRTFVSRPATPREHPMVMPGMVAKPPEVRKAGWHYGTTVTFSPPSWRFMPKGKAPAAADLKHLPAGKWALRVTFSSSGDGADKTVWKGKVASGPVRIEVGAKGAAMGGKSAQLALAAARKAFGGRKARMPDGKMVELKITVEPYAKPAAKRLAEFWPRSLFYLVKSSSPVVRTPRGGWGGTSIPGAVVVRGGKAEVLRGQSNERQKFFGRTVPLPDTAEKAETAARAFWALVSGSPVNERALVTGDKTGWKVKLSVQASPATIWVNPPEAGKKGCRVRWQRLSPPPPPPPPGKQPGR